MTNLLTAHIYSDGDFGLVADDGWVQALDPCRDAEETYLVQRCPACHLHRFHFAHMFDPMYDAGWCTCDMASCQAH